MCGVPSTLFLWIVLLLCELEVGLSSRLILATEEESNALGGERKQVENIHKDSASDGYSVQTNEVYNNYKDNTGRSFSFYQMFNSKNEMDDKNKQKDGSAVDLEYGVIGNLMEAKNNLGDGILMEATDIMQSARDSKGMEMIKSGVNIVLETVLKGIMEGFLPSVDRVRRDAEGDRRSYLDMFMSIIGAMMGKLRCSHFIACRMGKWFQGRLPSAQLVVMMMESFVPERFLEWFGVVKISVIDRSDNCDANYECSMEEIIQNS